MSATGYDAILFGDIFSQSYPRRLLTILNFLTGKDNSSDPMRISEELSAVNNMLEITSDIPQAICTTKNLKPIHQRLKQFGISKHFAHVPFFGKEQSFGGNIQMFHSVAKSLNVPIGRCLIVGGNFAYCKDAYESGAGSVIWIRSSDQEIRIYPDSMITSSINFKIITSISQLPALLNKRKVAA